MKRLRYAWLSDGREPTKSLDTLRKHLLAMSSKRLGPPKDHDAWVFAAQDRTASGMRSTAMQVALKTGELQVLSAQCIMAWIDVGNKYGSSIAMPFRQYWEWTNSKLGEYDTLEASVGPAMEALKAGESNQAEKNQMFVPHLEFFAHAKKVCVSVLCALQRCTKDRMREFLITNHLNALKGLYTSN